MARGQIFEGLFATMQADTTLPGILGPSTPTNPRIMRGYPQLQTLLASGYEPTSQDAWVVFREPDPYPTAMTAQYESSWEVLEVHWSVFAVRYHLTEEVIDVLDSYWHWTVDQQRDVQYGDRILIGSRRYRANEEYATEIKIPQKSVAYRMRFVLETQHA